MKNKIFVALFALSLSFFGISSISAADNFNNFIRTETKDKVLFIEDDNNGKFRYSWTFDKDEYKKNEFDFNLEIKFKSDKENEINDITGNVKKEFISFGYHGDLPSSATVKVPVNKNFKEGDMLKLYYYNDQAKKVELIDSRVRVINGYVTIEIEHCSDYFLTLSIIKEADNKGNNGIIIVAMLIIVVGLIGYTLFNRKK